MSDTDKVVLDLERRDVLVLQQVVEETINLNVAKGQDPKTADEERGELATWFKVLMHVRTKLNIPNG